MTPIAYKDRIQQYHGFKMNIDDEISKAFKKCPFCAETIQIEAVKCRYCGEWIEGGAATRAPAKYSDAQPVWHLVLLSIATFSLYNIYWVYRTWRQLRDQGSGNISPEWRLLGLFVPILGIILLYDFFKHVRNFAVCFWQVKRSPPSAVQIGTTPGKNIYLSSHHSFSSSGSL